MKGGPPLSRSDRVGLFSQRLKPLVVSLGIGTTEVVP